MSTPADHIKASLQIIAQLRDLHKNMPVVHQTDTAERDVAYGVMLGMVYGAVAEQCERADITFDRWVEVALATADAMLNETGEQ